MSLYERIGYKALKLFSLDQIAQWLAFLQHNKQLKIEQKEPIVAIDRLISDFARAERELINEV